MTARSHRFPIAMALLCSLAVTSCSSAHHRAAATTSAPSPPTSAAPSSEAPAPVPAPAINPLTGGKPSKNSVVAVKIEDTALGRPQRGIDDADLVYIEQVEGGLTRLLAIFNSKLPVVEPVRSTRANDPELAEEFGPIDYVASGGSHAELAPLDHSDLRADINDRGGPGFSRDPGRIAPNNLRADLAAIAAKLKGPQARSIGLVWSARLTATHTRPGTTVRTTVGGTPIVFEWRPAMHRYVRIIGGAVQHAADGHTIATPNVIVQFCRSTVYTKDRDILGNPAQYTHTIGSGKVVVFRDGRRIDGTWHRKALHDGTTLTDGSGRPIALSPGGAWFVLTATGTRLD